MKKTILIFFAVNLVVFISSAQISIKTPDGTPILDNDILMFNNIGDDANLITLITNPSTSSIDIKLIAETINGTDGSDMEFCIGLCRWGITQGVTYGPLTINAGATTGSTEVHFHNHDSNNDIITYAFKIYEDGNETNAIHFTYKYDVNYVELENVKSSKILVYPNPAKSMITIRSINNIVGSQFILTNLLGKVVYKQELSSINELVDVSDFDKGIYFYSIISNNKIIETKKLIIK